KLESLSSVSTASTKYVDVTQVIQPTNQPGTTGGAQAEGATGGQTGGAAAERAQGMGLTGLVEQNQQQIVALHKAIQANGALMGALESQNIPIDNVVAVDISDNGQVTVYYADLEPPESEGLKQSQPEAIPLPETGGGNTGGATGGAQ
ncbi:MAG TPA: hypothetical protein VF171_01950, partial [Trueperaceae bacterium]